MAKFQTEGPVSVNSFINFINENTAQLRGSSLKNSFDSAKLGGTFLPQGDFVAPHALSESYGAEAGFRFWVNNDALGIPNYSSSRAQVFDGHFYSEFKWAMEVGNVEHSMVFPYRNYMYDISQSASANGCFGSGDQTYRKIDCKLYHSNVDRNSREREGYFGVNPGSLFFAFGFASADTVFYYNADENVESQVVVGSLIDIKGETFTVQAIGVSSSGTKFIEFDRNIGADVSENLSLFLIVTGIGIIADAQNYVDANISQADQDYSYILDPWVTYRAKTYHSDHFDQMIFPQESAFQKTGANYLMAASVAGDGYYKKNASGLVGGVAYWGLMARMLSLPTYRKPVFHYSWNLYTGLQIIITYEWVYVSRPYWPGTDSQGSNYVFYNAPAPQSSLQFDAPSIRGLYEYSTFATKNASHYDQDINASYSWTWLSGFGGNYPIIKLPETYLYLSDVYNRIHNPQIWIDNLWNYNSIWHNNLLNNNDDYFSRLPNQDPRWGSWGLTRNSSPSNLGITSVDNSRLRLIDPGNSVTDQNEKVIMIDDGTAEFNKTTSSGAIGKTFDHWNGCDWQLFMARLSEYPEKVPVYLRAGDHGHGYIEVTPESTLRYHIEKVDSVYKIFEESSILLSENYWSSTVYGTDEDGDPIVNAPDNWNSSLFPDSAFFYIHDGFSNYDREGFFMNIYRTNTDESLNSDVFFTYINTIPSKKTVITGSLLYGTALVYINDVLFLSISDTFSFSFIPNEYQIKLSICPRFAGIKLTMHYLKVAQEGAELPEQYFEKSEAIEAWSKLHYNEHDYYYNNSYNAAESIDSQITWGPFNIAYRSLNSNPNGYFFTQNPLYYLNLGNMIISESFSPASTINLELQAFIKKTNGQNAIATKKISLSSYAPAKITKGVDLEQDSQRDVADILRLNLNLVKRGNNATGTISISQKSNIVTGQGTLFTEEIEEGDFLSILSNTNYQFEVDSIQSNTQLTLKSQHIFSDLTNEVARIEKHSPINAVPYDSSGQTSVDGIQLFCIADGDYYGDDKIAMLEHSLNSTDWTTVQTFSISSQGQDRYAYSSTLSGTISVTAGSKDVYGVGTKFLKTISGQTLYDEIHAGDIIFIDSSSYYVNEVLSETHLTISKESSVTVTDSKADVGSWKYVPVFYIPNNSPLFPQSENQYTYYRIRWVAGYNANDLLAGTIIAQDIIECASISPGNKITLATTNNFIFFRVNKDFIPARPDGTISPRLDVLAQSHGSIVIFEGLTCLKPNIINSLTFEYPDDQNSNYFEEGNVVPGADYMWQIKFPETQGKNIESLRNWDLDSDWTNIKKPNKRIHQSAWQFIHNLRVQGAGITWTDSRLGKYNAYPGTEEEEAYTLGNIRGPFTNKPKSSLSFIRFEALRRSITEYAVKPELPGNELIILFKRSITGTVGTPDPDGSESNDWFYTLPEKRLIGGTVSISPDNTHQQGSNIFYKVEGTSTNFLRDVLGFGFDVPDEDLPSFPYEFGTNSFYIEILGVEYEIERIHSNTELWLRTEVVVSAGLEQAYVDYNANQLADFLNQKIWVRMGLKRPNSNSYSWFAASFIGDAALAWQQGDDPPDGTSQVPAPGTFKNFAKAVMISAYYVSETSTEPNQSISGTYDFADVSNASPIQISTSGWSLTPQKVINPVDKIWKRMGYAYSLTGNDTAATINWIGGAYEFSATDTELEDDLPTGAAQIGSIMGPVYQNIKYLPKSTEGLKLNVHYLIDLPMADRLQVEMAARFWESIILDDIEMDVVVMPHPTRSVGGTLASATPSEYIIGEDSTFHAQNRAQIKEIYVYLDTDDIIPGAAPDSSYTATGREIVLDGVVPGGNRLCHILVHEIAHGLGVGTNWNVEFVGYYDDQYQWGFANEFGSQYSGPEAVAQYQNIINSATHIMLYNNQTKKIEKTTITSSMRSNFYTNSVPIEGGSFAQEFQSWQDGDVAGGHIAEYAKKAGGRTQPTFVELMSPIYDVANSPIKIQSCQSGKRTTPSGE
jgi:hypothetical protein